MRAEGLGKAITLGIMEESREGGRQRMRWIEGATQSFQMKLQELNEVMRNRNLWMQTDSKVSNYRGIYMTIQ